MIADYLLVVALKDGVSDGVVIDEHGVHRQRQLS